MTEQEIQDLGPAFAAYLARFRPDLGDIANVAHLRNYCRGLLADLPRKSRRAHRPGRRGLRPQPAAVPQGVRLGRGGRSRPDPAPPGGRRRRATRRPGRDRGGDRRDQLRQAGGQDPGRPAAVPGVRGQGGERDRHRPPGLCPRAAQGPAGRGAVPAQVLGRGPGPVPGRRHPGRRRVPAEVADRPGPGRPGPGERVGVRLADVRRGVRRAAQVLAALGRGRPAVRGRGPGHLPGAGRPQPGRGWAPGTRSPGRR